MGLKINGIGSIFAPFFKGEGRKIQEDISVQEAAGGRDSYVSSAVGDEQMYTSGNYGQQGEMDDDFSVKLPEEDENIRQAAQYSEEYAVKAMKTTAGTQPSGGGMAREPGK